MNNEFELFNQMFPNSKYRLVNPRVELTSDDEELLKKYQDSKRPINDKTYSYDDLQSMKDNINNANLRIGWIVSEGYVVVDIDNKSDARVVFDILQSKQIKFSFTMSKHGGHFIFKNEHDVGQCAGKFTSIGIKVDTRVENKGYIILPVHDEDRKWGNITNDIDVIPKYLIPISNLRVDSEFLGMGLGDGRNDALLKHMLNLIDYAKFLDIDDKVEAIHIINDYLFKDKLSEEELDKTVLRKEIKDKNDESTGEEEGSCLEERIAVKILKKYNLISTSNGMFYIYNGKYYQMIKDNKEIERIIHFEYGKSLKERNRLEIIKFLLLKSFVSPDKINAQWNEIVLRNGIFNLSTKTLKPHTPSQYNTIYVDCNYVEEAPFSKIIDDFFNTLAATEPQKKTLLYELIGYCLLRRNIFSKFFILYGEGKTGKSTYLQIMKKLLGLQNVTFLDLKDLENQWLPSELFGKLVNLGDDIGYRGLKDSSILKKLVTGEEFAAQIRYKEPIYFSNFAKLIYTTNQLPTIDDKTSGLYRRLMIIEINHIIENPDPAFLYNIQDADLEYLLWKSINAISDAVARGELTSCPSSDRLLQGYIIDQSSILSYIHDKGLKSKDFNKKPCSEVYSDYEMYCRENGILNKYKKSRFDTEITRIFKLAKRNTTIDGTNQCWRFVDVT